MSFNYNRSGGQQRGGYGYQDMRQQQQQQPAAFNNGNILAGLAPEAQVALASTLLSTLLQNQQQIQNASVGYGMAGGPGPSFVPYQQQYQQQQDFRDDRRGFRNEPPMKQRRFGGERGQDDRRGRGVGGRGVGNSNPRREEFRRKDARTKNANDNRDRKPPAKKAANLPKKTPFKKGAEKLKKEAETKVAEVKPETKEKSDDVETPVEEKKEEPEKEIKELGVAVEGEVEKVKEEVKEGGEKEEEVVKADEGEEKEAKAEEKAADEAEKKIDFEEKKKLERANDKTPFAGIPESYLYCHVCEKQVWDGPSFLRHIRGNKHKSLMNRLEKIYEATILSLRLISQLDEQRRTLDIDSKFGFGRQKSRPRKTKCAMCDMSFYGSLLSHRTNQAHQALKNYIHPKCDACDLEFPSKIEHDVHMLTSKHIKKQVEKFGEGQFAPHLKVIDVLMEELDFRPEVRTVSVEGAGEPTSPGDDETFDIDVAGKYDIHTPCAQTEIRTRTVYYCEKCAKFIEHSDKDKLAHIESEQHLKNVETKTKPKEESVDVEVKKDDDDPMVPPADVDETVVIDEVGADEEGEAETPAVGADEVAMEITTEVSPEAV